MWGERGRPLILRLHRGFISRIGTRNPKKAHDFENSLAGISMQANIGK